MHRTLRFSLFLAIAAVALTFSAAKAQFGGGTIVRIEEDWELVVQEPDANSVGPQVVCTMSPVGDVDGNYATLEVNHQGLPEFVAGGLQLQMWSGEYPLDSRKFPNGAVMATSDETVRWTQAMQITEGGVLVEITNGSSTTWGQFGGQGYLRDTLASNLDNLNAYDTDVSVAKSGVSYASNRVQSLVLKRVRAYTSDGHVHEDTTSRTVYQHAHE